MLAHLIQHASAEIQQSGRAMNCMHTDEYREKLRRNENLVALTKQPHKSPLRFVSACAFFVCVFFPFLFSFKCEFYHTRIQLHTVRFSWHLKCHRCAVSGSSLPFYFIICCVSEYQRKNKKKRLKWVKKSEWVRERDSWRLCGMRNTPHQKSFRVQSIFLSVFTIKSWFQHIQCHWTENKFHIFSKFVNNNDNNKNNAVRRIQCQKRQRHYPPMTD